MSKISHYVSLHRRSRTKFLSISDYNSKYNASIPENKAVEAAFHSDLRRKRKMMFPPRGLYPIARELGIEKAAPVSKTLRSRARSRMSKLASSPMMCDHSTPCSCLDREEAVEDTPVRRVGMKLNNISISRSMVPPVPEKPSVLHAIDARRKHQSHPHFDKAHRQRHSSRSHPSKGGHHQLGPGGRRKAIPAAPETEFTETSNHETFTTADVRAFYNKINPEFLETKDLNEVVSGWNRAPLNGLMQSIREKYGIAPRDLWSVDDVKAYYNHYNPDFLKTNNVHEVMTEWLSVEPSVLQENMRLRWGSLPGEPFKKVHWTPQIVVDYYSEVFPAKLQKSTPEDIIQDWNRYSVEKVRSACESKYGLAPTPQGYTEPSAVSPIEMYKRELENSATSFDATKVLHFVPMDCNFSEDFHSHASKFKSSVARFLIDGIKGPYKMMSGEYKTFSAINKDDVGKVLRAIKQNKSGDFFIRVEE